jgi:hypothetical protein
MISVILFLLSAQAFAAGDSAPVDSRPSEDSIFGGQQAAPPVAPPSETGQATAPAEPAGSLRDAFASGEVTDNPLQIGGVYYQQLIVSGQSGVNLSNTPVTAPLQFDGYLDGRPNDRIRVFVDGRLLYDPTRNQYSNSTNSNSFDVQSLQTQSTTQSAGTSSSGTNALGAATTPNNPQVVLDQVWLKWDIDRTVFVTAGKQHVKWGTSRFWNPTDFLSTQRRNPLLPYDLRLGNYMVKFELPLESKKTNISAIALFDNPQPASTLGQLGGALRGETLIGNAEVGVEAVVRGGVTPVYGADVSAPVGQFDVYAEAACITGGTPVYQATSLTPGTDISTVFGTTNIPGPSLQVSGGVSRDFAWKEDRQATLGVEYFYNQIGYTNTGPYRALIFTGNYQPFYTGRNYAAIYLTAEGPDALKHTSYTFSTLSNLSDRSFISRADLSWRVLTYLTFDTYLDGHYGTPGGEFNFAFTTPALTNAGTAIPAISVPATFFDVGVSMRVSI